MIGISIQFLSGRYHSTPWDRHCNEGVPEPFPSPWRILRALVAASHKVPESVDHSVVNQLLEKMASELPCYTLPFTTESHTRHFMPLWKEAEFKTSQVIDAFQVYGSALSEDARVNVVWRKLDLSEGEINLLEQLCSFVGYMGRSESWVDITLLKPRLSESFPNLDQESSSISDYSSDSEASKAHRRAIPTNSAIPPGITPIKTLAPLSLTELVQFQTDMAALKLPKVVKQTVPSTMLEALELDVGQMKKQGWSGIPGTKWCEYIIQEPQQPKQFATSKQDGNTRLTYARFAIAGSVLPLFKDAVSVGDRFHQALNKLSDGEWVFSGRDENGEPLKGKPLHARYLSEWDSRGRINYLNVVAEGRFNDKAKAALAQLRRLWGEEGHDLSVALVALGDAKAFIDRYYHLLGQSSVWRSVTPLILPRFPKTKIDPDTGLQKDGLEYQVIKMLKDLQFDRPLTIDLTEGKWMGWKIHRHKQSHRRVPNVAYGLELKFKTPQAGVMCLGYNSHYGLGLFSPVIDARTGRCLKTPS
jgi:CRISPR-associated protein Csb2